MTISSSSCHNFAASIASHPGKEITTMRTGWRLVFMMLALILTSATVGFAADEPIPMAAYTGIWAYSSSLSEPSSHLDVAGEVHDALHSFQEHYDSSTEDSPETENLVEAIQEEMEMSRTVIIGQSDDGLVLAGDSGRLRTLIGVGPIEACENGDRTVSVTAHWDGS